MSASPPTPPPAPLAVADKLIDPLMRSFMYGQFANLFKFAFWWVALSPLLYSLCNGSEAIGIGRIVYNTALCIASPFGPLLIEHVSPRSILLSAAAVRFVVWCVLLPLNWVLFDTDVADAKSTIGVYVVVVIMLLLDGFSVGISSVLDIDFMGVDIFAGFLGREVTEEHRNQFNSRQELFFALCFMFFSPGMAFGGLGLKEAFNKWKENGSGALNMNFEQVESGTLAAIFIVTFFVATIFQFYYFWPLTPENAQKIDEALEAAAVGSAGSGSGNNTSSARSLGTVNGEEGKRLLDGNQNPNDEKSPQKEGEVAPEGHQEEGEEHGPPPTTGQIICNVLGDLKESFFLVISHRAILFRLIFFGFELAFEDASIVVLAAQLGIRVPWMGGGDGIRGNIWTAVIVAVGKFGAAIASFIMMKHYHPPENIMGHTRLFISIGISTLVIIIIPVAFDGYSDGHLSADAARALVFVAFFLYFFFSTLPKLGLMSLLQTMVSQVENGHRAFAFIAILATTIDSVVIMALSLLFANADKQNDSEFSRSLWITCFVFLGHGILETLFGPILVLRPAEADAEKMAAIMAEKQKEEEEEERKKKQQEGFERDDDVEDDSNNNKNDDDVTFIKPKLLGDGNSVNVENNNNAIGIPPRSPRSPRDGEGNSPNTSNQQQPEMYGSYSARAVAVPSNFRSHSNLNNNTNETGGISVAVTGYGSLSARNRGASHLQGGGGAGGGGISPRIGGLTPRSYQRSLLSGLGGANNNAQELADQQQQPIIGSVRQNMLGRSLGGGLIAASVAIPQRGASRLDGNNNNNNNTNNNNNDEDATAGAGSYVRSARGKSYLGDGSTSARRNNSNFQ